MEGGGGAQGGKAITFRRAAPLPPRPDIAAKRRRHTQHQTHPCIGATDGTQTEQELISQ